MKTFGVVVSEKFGGGTSEGLSVALIGDRASRKVPLARTEVTCRLSWHFVTGYFPCVDLFGTRSSP